MNWLFSVVASQLRTLFLADLALDVRGKFFERNARRRVELEELAQSYEQRGFGTIAAELRTQTKSLSAQGQLDAIGFTSDSSLMEPLADPHVSEPGVGMVDQLTSSSKPKAKGRRKAR